MQLCLFLTPGLSGGSKLVDAHSLCAAGSLFLPEKHSDVKANGLNVFFYVRAQSTPLNYNFTANIVNKLTIALDCEH